LLKGMQKNIARYFNTRSTVEKEDDLIYKIANFDFSELRDSRIFMADELMSKKGMRHFRPRKLNKAMGDIHAWVVATIERYLSETDQSSKESGFRSMSMRYSKKRRTTSNILGSTFESQYIGSGRSMRDSAVTVHHKRVSQLNTSGYASLGPPGSPKS